MAKITNQYPQFVMMGGNSALRLVHEGRSNYFYFRDGGEWSVDIRKDEYGDMFSSSHIDTIDDHKLTAITEKEWRECNGRYAPVDFERFGWEYESTNPPKWGSNPCVEIALPVEKTNRYKYLLIR
jgi:hypothetical protein